MPAAAFQGTIETVRGRLSAERADQLLRFWSDHGALEGEAARRRLREVVCVALDGDGQVAGVNSAYPQDVAVVGRRFWVYRSLLPPEASSAEPGMINAAFAALEEEHNPGGEGPIGLCVPVADPAEIVRRPEVLWPDTELMFAGYGPDGTQMRVRYFDDARVGPGLPNSPSLGSLQSVDYSIGERFRVEPFSDASVTAEEVLAFWERQGAMPSEEARRRVDEVLSVVVERDEGLVGLSTAYLQRSEQLRMDLWYFRTFVAAAHRHGHVATQLTFHNRDLLEHRFVSGEDTRAQGVAFELENEGVRRYYNIAVWPTAGFTYIGDNRRGDPIRVHYFPGARAPAPE